MHSGLMYFQELTLLGDTDFPTNLYFSKILLFLENGFNKQNRPSLKLCSPMK